MRTASKIPTDKERSLIADQARIRGQIIGGYTQSEFLLLDVAMQVRILQEYWGLELKYHRKLDNRITQARRLFSAPGPLAKYANRVLPLIDRLEPLKDHRDFFAHAFCRIHYSKSEVYFIYNMWRMDDGKAWRDERIYSLPDIEKLQNTISELAQDFILLFAEIYLHEELEAFSEHIKTMPQ